MQLVTVDDADMDEDQRRRVSEGDTVMALGKGGDSIRVFAGMVGTPWVLEIGPLYQMNPYPPQWLVLIAALGLTLIGLIVYLLVRQLERRLRGLEAAATRIAKGSLETRVPARGADSVGRLASAFNGMAEHLQRYWRSSVNWCVRCPMNCARRWRGCVWPGNDRLGNHAASPGKVP